MFTLPQQVYCGYFDSSFFGKLTQTPSRTAQMYEIEIYLEDGLNRILDGRVFPVRKNYVQIVKPGQVGSTQLPFRTAFLKLPATGRLAELLDATPDYFCSSRPEQMLSLMDEIMKLRESEKELLLFSKLLDFFDMLLSDARFPDTKTRSNYPLVKKAKAFIQEHLAEPIRLLDIAGSVHLSEVYFHTVFTETAGVTPHAYLTSCRIEKAKRLLWDSSVSISRIADETGFGCQQYLCKAFKKETGMTPGAYRRSFQQKYLL